MTPRTELFLLEEFNFFFKFESKNWIFQKFHFKLLTLFWIWLTELNFFFWNMTHRIEPFLKILTHRDWTLLFNMSQRTVVIHFWNNLFRVQFFESFCEEGSILWVKLNLRVRIFESHQKNSILGVISQKKVQSFGSYQKEVQFFESSKNVSFIFIDIFGKSILRVIFSKRFHSMRHF